MVRYTAKRCRSSRQPPWHRQGDDIQSRESNDLWHILTQVAGHAIIGGMAKRQTRNVSLPPGQDAFVDAMVQDGRYRSASEVVRDGLRLLQESEHRRLLEKWLYEGLSTDEEEWLPSELKERARKHFQGLVDSSLQDVENGRVKDGRAAMQRIREKLDKARPD